MLTAIHEKVKGIFATIILLMVGVPFILWGINSYFESGPTLSVAKVDGTAISQRDYRAALEQFRGRLDPKTAESAAFKQMVLDGLIEQTLLVRDAENNGYRVGDLRLGQIIRGLPYFQRNGSFDPQLYESLLRREGIGVQEFEERLRSEFVTGQIQGGLAGSGFVTDAEVQALVRLLRQERELAYTVIRTEPLAARASVTPAEIEQHYAAHGDQFLSPEQVRVEYLRLAVDDLAKQVSPGEEELRKAYADEASPGATEKRRASHILLALPENAPADAVQGALAKARDIEKQARAGKDFAALARKYSEDATTAPAGGDLGEVKPGVLPMELDDALRALTPGQVSAPVRTAYGYHLLKLTARSAAPRKAFAERRAELVKLVRTRKAEERFFDLTEKFQTAAYEHPDSLAAAAAVLGVETQKSAWFTRAGGDGIAASPKVVEAAFSAEVLTQGRNSDPIEAKPGTLVAVRLLEHRPAQRRPLAEVRAQIERQLRQQQAEAEARKQADDLLQQLRSGMTLSAAASKRGLSVQPAKIVTREKATGVDPRIVAAAFRLSRPEAGKPVHDSVALGSLGVAVLALTRVMDAEPGRADAATVEKVRQLLGQHHGADYYAMYRGGLRQKAELKVFADRL